MLVYHFGGKCECSSIDSLLDLLNVRFENNSNEYELYLDSEYPHINLLVKDELACVHYFQSENDCGRYAYTKNTGLLEDEVTEFFIGSATAKTEISNRLVIPFSVAVNIVKHFYEHKEMFELVEWFEL